MMKKKPLLLLLMSVMLVFALGQSVLAFSDTASDPNAAKIEELKQRGIISGENGKFIPKGKLTHAAAVSLLVKGFDLNLDGINFVKEPKASDYFTNVNDNAWYADAFIIAGALNLGLPRDLQPNGEITREQYAHALMEAVYTTGDYAFIEIYIGMADEADVDPAYMGGVQRVLISKFAELDANQNFHPKAAITRSDAASWLLKAIKFVESTPPIEPLPEEPYTSPLSELKFETEAVNEDIQKVTVTATVPHPGYGLRIVSITFLEDQAEVLVAPTYPDPDMMYPQVITDVSATTYVSSDYKVVLVEELASIGGGSDSVVASPPSAPAAQ
ncbi:S-layer homology domain-containing protein [Paenibacillus sp. 1P07SE]|uniref:S-layer homology domain-containing protein n=1 Tax=Paenibacillus sp. 1P07SE TaxID=3132209 RepID=UPI0039A616DF